jgi:hypothetical protein
MYYYCSKYSLTYGFLAFHESGGVYSVGDFMTKNEIVKPNSIWEDFYVLLLSNYFLIEQLLRGWWSIG